MSGNEFSWTSDWARDWSSAVSDRSSDTTAADDEPLLAGAAIEQGLQVYKDGDTERALQLFQRSLTLPGTGMKRFRLSIATNLSHQEDSKNNNASNCALQCDIANATNFCRMKGTKSFRYRQPGNLKQLSGIL